MVENSIGAIFIQSLLSYKIIVILLSFLSFHLANFVTEQYTLASQKSLKLCKDNFTIPALYIL